MYKRQTTNTPYIKKYGCIQAQHSTTATYQHDAIHLKNQSQLVPSIILFLAAALWGIFWLPLRHIESAGISGLWAVFAINVVPLTVLLPVVFYRRRFFSDKLKTKCLVGIGLGGGMAFYAVAILYTTVLQTTLLFYMSPVWATLLARVILKEQINPRRWLAIAVGFAGILLILSGTDTGTVGINLNRGDLFALLSGLLWGYGTVLVKGSSELPAIDLLPSQYFWATVISVVLIATTIGTQTFRTPDFSQWLSAMPVIVGFFVLIT